MLLLILRIAVNDVPCYLVLSLAEIELDSDKMNDDLNTLIAHNIHSELVGFMLQFRVSH